MSIASAFNEITVAQGGTASKSGSIAGAIDKLNDVLAGSDQPGAETIEQAIRLLGQHIGGGGATLGELAFGSVSIDEVTVDSIFHGFKVAVMQIKIGNSVVTDSSDSAVQIAQIASGVDVVMYLDNLTFVKAYDVTVDGRTAKYTTVEEIDIHAENITIEIEGETLQALKYTVPTLDEGHDYVLYCTE